MSKGAARLPVFHPLSHSTKLSEKELQVFRATAEGLVCKEVASAMGISENNAKQIRNRAMHKLGGLTVPHAVLLACRAGILK